MSSFQTILRGHLTPDDKANADYAYLPFDLPFATSHLHLRYSYSARMSSDRVEGGNVIDIGLFDPRGSHFPGGAGFRGWSGSARSEFFIGLHDATPGYLPGPLPAGRYKVLLGLYRIWPQGADYEVQIDARPIAEPMEAPPRASIHAKKPAEQAAPIWLRGDLQSHTHHSDARGSPKQLTDKARALELDFLAITDHNTVSHHPLLSSLEDEKLLLIPGQEVTTYFGHMNVWGTSQFCDFRSRTRHDIAAIIDLARDHGAVCSINHPKIGGPAWEYGFDLDVQALEVWQGPWPYRNDESLALWDRLLDEGRRLPGVGGSDYHCPAAAETGLLRLGQPTTWVNVRARTVDAILDAICTGRLCISAHPHGPRLDLAADSRTDEAVMGGVLSIAPGEAVALTVHIVDGGGYRLHVVADGLCLEEHAVSNTEEEVHLSVTASKYIRCELVADMAQDKLPAGVPDDLDLRDWRWALSNPIYLRVA